MAMGAVLEMALGIDILKIEGKKQQGRQPQIPSFDLVPAAGVSDHPDLGGCPGDTGLQMVRLSPPESVRPVLRACWLAGLLAC